MFANVDVSRKQLHKSLNHKFCLEVVFRCRRLTLPLQVAIDVYGPAMTRSATLVHSKQFFYQNHNAQIRPKQTTLTAIV